MRLPSPALYAPPWAAQPAAALSGASAAASDSHSKWASELGMADDMSGCEPSIPPLVDIPITKVCELLYGASPHSPAPAAPPSPPTMLRAPPGAQQRISIGAARLTSCLASGAPQRQSGATDDQAPP